MKNAIITKAYKGLAAFFVATVLVVPAISFAQSTDTINGWNNSDTINGWNNTDTINGWDNTDTINGWNNSDTINGWNNTDTVNGWSYSQPYYGGGYSYTPYMPHSYGTVGTGGFYGGTLTIVPPMIFNYQSTVTTGGPIFTTPIYTNPIDNTLTGSCTANVSSVGIGSLVTWTATAFGGNGVHNYFWTGDEGLSGNGQFVSRAYSFAGIKNATVTITSNGQTVTRTCSVQVTGNQVLAYTDNANLTSVYLSDLPYTGAGDVAKIVGFILALILWSAVLAYAFMKRNVSLEAVVARTPVLVSTQKATVREAIAETIATDSKDVEQVIAYARTLRVLLSTEAAAELVKIARKTKKNISGLVQNMAGNDWIAVGAEDIR